MDVLKPLENALFGQELESLFAPIIKALGADRLSGGSFPTTFASFEQIACATCYGATSQNKVAVLQEFFRRRGFALFEDAILIATVCRFVQDAEYIPTNPGVWDISASISTPSSSHREITIRGEEIPITAVWEEFAELMQEESGIVTLCSVGKDRVSKSLELVLPEPTPGMWREIKDIQFGRNTGIIIVASAGGLNYFCPGLDINNFQPALLSLDYFSPKVLQAMEVAKRVYARMKL